MTHGDTKKVFDVRAKALNKMAREDQKKAQKKLERANQADLRRRLAAGEVIEPEMEDGPSWISCDKCAKVRAHSMDYPRTRRP